MNDHVLVTVGEVTYRITPDMAQKYGEPIPPSPADYQRKVLGKMTDKEWEEFSSSAGMIAGVGVSSMGAIIRPVVDKFLEYRCGKLPTG